MTTGLDKRLTVLDDGTDRQSWLAARIPVITATQAAAIVGSHPYTKLIEVWNEKTDPEHDFEVLENRWLEERAQLGREREQEIILWAGALPSMPRGAGFFANKALVTLPQFAEPGLILPPAATPDAYQIVNATKRNETVELLECKTTEQDWESDGLPQHVYDQGLWQLYTTGAAKVHFAVERYEWTGKGASRVATPIGRFVATITLEDVGARERLDFILQEVERFRAWYVAGQAPESDIYMAEVLADFDADPADVEAFTTADELLTELAEIEDRIKADSKRADAIKALVKPVVKAYDGRRIHLIGTRMIAKLVRFNKATEDVKLLDPDTRRSITSWGESERVVFEPNPEWIDPAESAVQD